MRNWARPFILLALSAAVGCTPANTLPAPVSPDATVQYYDLEIPPDLEIKSVDFSAATFSDRSKSMTSNSDRGRAFVKVYAVHRTSGEQFLVLYEDITRRKRPMQVIRFLRGTDEAQPDSAK